MEQEATNQIPEEESTAPETAPEVEDAAESSAEWEGFVDAFDSDDVEEIEAAPPPVEAEKQEETPAKADVVEEAKTTEPAPEEKPQEPVVEEVVEEAKAPE